MANTYIESIRRDLEEIEALERVVTAKLEDKTENGFGQSAKGGLRRKHKTHSTELQGDHFIRYVCRSHICSPQLTI